MLSLLFAAFALSNVLAESKFESSSIHNERATTQDREKTDSGNRILEKKASWNLDFAGIKAVFDEDFKTVYTIQFAVRDGTGSTAMQARIMDPTCQVDYSDNGLTAGSVMYEQNSVGMVTGRVIADPKMISKAFRKAPADSESGLGELEFCYRVDHMAEDGNTVSDFAAVSIVSNTATEQALSGEFESTDEITSTPNAEQTMVVAGYEVEVFLCDENSQATSQTSRQIEANGELQFCLRYPTSGAYDFQVEKIDTISIARGSETGNSKTVDVGESAILGGVVVNGYATQDCTEGVCRFTSRLPYHKWFTTESRPLIVSGRVGLSSKDNDESTEGKKSLYGAFRFEVQLESAGVLTEPTETSLVFSAGDGGPYSQVWSLSLLFVSVSLLFEW